MAATVFLVSPEVIILGGGVMQQAQLFPLVREKTKQLIAGYLETDELADMDRYIVPASCGGDQGILGCFVLAQEALPAS